ncbi:flavoprotein [Modestobacter italicus]|uniref:flavoprotein n=1 Tax=Modestobacter italicus (strain DSM 44449 / CECT 9708 / BC 501) TaxID=2732864 RepID=UPI001C96E074|nr:flavoprotein [Modestobacter italicus]
MTGAVPDPGKEFADVLAGLGGRRVALVVTGSLSAAFLPYWLNFVEQLPHPPELRVLLTRSATGMVSPAVVGALLGREAEIDAWDAVGAGHAAHVELAEWAEGFLVHPCTFSYLGRVANGLADTPGQLALQCSTRPVVLCPALPPGTLESPAYRRLRALLDEREDVTVLDPGVGRSAATGRQEGLPPVQFPVALAALATVLAEGRSR